MDMVTRIVQSFFLKNNIRLIKVAEGCRLQQFLNSIKPFNTDHPLIRLGGEADGGYLIPDDLKGIKFCFSPGVSDVADFELDLTRRGIKCFLADYSVDSPPVQSPLFDFEKKYLGPNDSDEFITLENWIKSKAANEKDFILQMDIEGAEYGVIFVTSSETLRKFRILVIEFHGLNSILSRIGLEYFGLVFDKLLKDFEVVHIHPNNSCPPVKYRQFEIPPIMEFTFLRKDRISRKSPRLDFPHKLDRTNVPTNRDVVLPKCWYYAP
jgi:hypothetical protein